MKLLSINKLISSLKTENKLPQVLVLLSFVVTYSIMRAITHLQKAHLLPNQNGPLHIHHMVPGIILLLITGYSEISYGTNQKVKLTCAVLFGIGAALTIDE